MSKKPHTLQFGADDKPPLLITLVVAIQHIGLIMVTLIVPLLLCRADGASPAATRNVLSLAMATLAVSTLLLALRKGPVGIGLLAPSNFTVLYLGPSLQAVRLGGMGLMAGMTIFSGLTEIALSRAMPRLRPLLPPELAGLVIFLVGITTSLVGLSSLLAPGQAASQGTAQWLVAGITLATMVAVNVWTKGFLRLSSALIGIIAGYIASFATGLLTMADFAPVGAQQILALPSLGALRWSFDPHLILPFVVAALAGSLKAIAVVTAYQRMNDAEWVRPDMRGVGRGVMADGLGAAICGVFGTPAANLAPSNLGLVAATGVASRFIAYAISAILAVLAFFPPVAAAFILMPQPVIAAMLIFTSAFILITGIETMASRLLDARRTLVIGLAIIAGISAEVFPEAFKALPVLLAPLFGSAVVFGTVVALVLNLVFRLGIKQRGILTIDPAHYDHDAVSDFMQDEGAGWGARRDVILRADHAVQQLIESIIEHGEPRGPIEIEASFDEFSLVVTARYSGVLLETPSEAPSLDMMTDTEDGVRLLAGYLLRNIADRIVTSSKGGECSIRLHFEH